MSLEFPVTLTQTQGMRISHLKHPKEQQITWIFVPKNTSNSPTAEEHKGSVSPERHVPAHLPSDIFLPFFFNLGATVGDAAADKR